MDGSDFDRLPRTNVFGFTRELLPSDKMKHLSGLSGLSKFGFLNLQYLTSSSRQQHVVLQSQPKQSGHTKYAWERRENRSRKLQINTKCYKNYGALPMLSSNINRKSGRTM